MYTIACAIDVTRHLWIPTTGLVPKVGASFHHFGKRDNGHGFSVGFRVCLHLPGIAIPACRKASSWNAITRNTQVCGVKGTEPT
jgi:hypothetical protein